MIRCFLILFLAITTLLSVFNESVVHHDKQLHQRNHSVETMLSSRKSLLLCNPDTASLFSKFFMQRWMDAKTEIGNSIAASDGNYEDSTCEKKCTRFSIQDTEGAPATCQKQTQATSALVEVGEEIFKDHLIILTQELSKQEEELGTSFRVRAFNQTIR